MNFHCCRQPMLPEHYPKSSIAQLAKDNQYQEPDY